MVFIWMKSIKGLNFLGLRHLTVVDEDNSVVGILTRKDLMGFSIEERLSK